MFNCHLSETLKIALFWFHEEPSMIRHLCLAKHEPIRIDVRIRITKPISGRLKSLCPRGFLRQHLKTEKTLGTRSKWWCNVCHAKFVRERVRDSFKKIGSRGLHVATAFFVMHAKEILSVFLCRTRLWIMFMREIPTKINILANFWKKKCIHILSPSVKHREPLTVNDWWIQTCFLLTRMSLRDALTKPLRDFKTKPNWNVSVKLVL